MTIPGALTREQAALLADELRTCHHDVYAMKRDGLVGYLVQQAQEIERLEGVCLDRLRSGQLLADENILLRQSIAAMTTERDEAVNRAAELEEFKSKLLEKVKARGLVGAETDRDKELVSDCLFILLERTRATLAAREERIAVLETALFGDEVVKLREHVASLAAELYSAQQEATRLRDRLKQDEVEP